jgi:4-hydroxybenzoate polyprenyltransferase
LIREAIKDMEDMEGDLKYGCTTMPIVWGLPASKVFVGVWIIVLAGLVAAIQIYVIFKFAWWFSAFYSLITIIIPLIWVLRKLFVASSPAQFHQISYMVKIIMAAGILSMMFF